MVPLHGEACGDRYGGKYGAGLALEVIGKGLSELGIDADDVVIGEGIHAETCCDFSIPR